MKKAITTILSVLMLVSCLTVNVFAVENENPQNPSDQPSEETYDDVQTQTEEKSVLDNSDEQDKEKTPSATEMAVLSFEIADNNDTMNLNFIKGETIGDYDVWIMGADNEKIIKEAFFKALDEGNITDPKVKIGQQEQISININGGVINNINKFAVHSIVDIGTDKHLFIFSDLFDVVDFSRVKSVELICGESKRTINLSNSEFYKGTIYYKPDDVDSYLVNGSSYTVRVNYSEGDPVEFSYSSSISEDDNFKVCCGTELFATGIGDGRFICFAWNFERLQNNTGGSENNNPSDNNPEENLKDIYARKVITPPNSNNIEYSELTEKSPNVVSVDIYSDERFGIFFGDEYNNTNSDNDKKLTNDDVSIIKSTGIDVTCTNDIFSIHSTHSDSTAKITYNGQSLIFKSKFPDVGVYTSNVIADETYCAKYNDSRREFYINVTIHR